MPIWPLGPRPSFGRTAEILGCRYLHRRGFLILASPYRAAHGEIDIVARDREHLVFVEVKARRRDPHPEDAVNALKRKRLLAAAREFRRRNPRYLRAPVRFDILSVVVPALGKTVFTLYQDAFRESGAGRPPVSG